MHLLSATDLAKTYDGRTLFSGASFGLTTSDHVGVVGNNGAGKSTLLRLLAGEEDPDDGQIVFNAQARVSYLHQQPTTSAGETAFEAASNHGDPSIQPHQVSSMLDRLGVPEDAIVDELSGGQQRRVALAAALLPESDLLILDEPTNHLDVDTVDWLEAQLKRRRGGMLLITHDRYFLERLTNRMLEVHDGRVYSHEGTYATVLEARALRETQSASMEAKRANLWRKELAWLRRGPKARSSKPKFRVDQANALGATEGPAEVATLDLGTGRRRLGNKIVDLKSVSLSYGDTPVIRALDLALAKGERVGIVGPNGAGKTTLLRLIGGTLEPTSGTRDQGETVEIGYYEQQTVVPPSGKRVLDTITDIAEWIPLANGERLTASSLAERFLFDGRLQRTEVSLLSGGERRRLALLHILVAAPNVLLLDEPTNDLDLDTLAILEDHLDGFAGTLVVASHDRYLLDRVTDVILAVAPDGTIHRFQDWEQYRESAIDEAGSSTGRRVGSAPPSPSATPVDSAQVNRDRQAARKRVRQVETRLRSLDTERTELDRKLAAAISDYNALAELGKRRADVVAQINELEEEWLALAEE